METKDLNHFKTLFCAMRETLLEKSLNTDFEGDVSGDVIDQTLNEREAGLQLKLQSRDRLFLKKIDHALEKIESGTFGQCEECDGDITLNRLLARPIATQCIHCKEEQERGEIHLAYKKRSKTLGKTLVNENTNVVSFPGDSLISKEKVVSLEGFTKKLEEGALTS